MMGLRSVPACQSLLLRLRWWNSPHLRGGRGLMSLSLYRRCFLCPDGRPRLAHQRYRGEQRKTGHHHFRLTAFTWNALRTKTACLMCHHFPGSESPVSLPVYAWPSGWTFLLDPTLFQTVLASETSSLPPAGSSAAAPHIDLGDGRLLDRTAGLSVQILGVRRPTIFG